MSWWLDDGQDSGVWPIIVRDVNIFGVTVEGTHEGGPYFGERVTVAPNRVYNHEFKRATREDVVA